jgi:hypothetical protein
MSGSGGRTPDPIEPELPPPAPMPLEIEEAEAAKRKARKGAQGRGRPSTILAGRLVSERGKRLLGE